MSFPGAPPPPPPVMDEMIPRPPTPPGYPSWKKETDAHQQSQALTTNHDTSGLDSKNIFGNVNAALATSKFPAAGTVSSGGGIVESSKYEQRSNMRDDGVQHSQRWKVKMLGESGHYGQANEWFQKHGNGGNNNGNASDDETSD